jgi:hypothetical protein
MTNDEIETIRDSFDDGWNHDVELVVREEGGENRIYDLEERTARCGEAIIDFANTIPQSAVTNRIISQLSVPERAPAQIMLMPTTLYRKRILKSIGTCKKEAREVKHSLKLPENAELKRQARKLWIEAKELHLIFSRIWRSGKNKR